MAEQHELLNVDEATSSLIALITGISKALVDAPDQVSVEHFEDAGTTVLQLEVAPGDVGKIIGKQGRTARSLRTIIGAASMKYKRRFSLDIVEAGDDGEDTADSEA